MTNFNETVQNATSLENLCEILNSYSPSENNGLKLSDAVSLCDLPLFSDDAPKNTTECFSFNDDNVLIDNTSLCNGGWEIVPRCNNCHEAGFNCGCSE